MFVAPNNAIGASLYKKLPFNFIRDSAPVAGTLRLANLMVVPPSLPVNSVAEFIAYARANPGKLNFASSGNGTSVHMSGELFKLMAGIDIVHVPYRGSSAAYPDLMSGKVHVLFDNLPGSIGFARGGQLKALGVTTAQRWPSTAGDPGDRRDREGLRGERRGTASRRRRARRRAIVDKLNKAVNAALADPALVKRFAELGAVTMPMTPEEFGQLVVDETEKWRKVVEFAGVSVD